MPPTNNALTIENLRKEIKSAVENAFSQKLMKTLGEDMAERIRVRTRTGKGVDRTGGETTALKRLMSEPYKKRRRKSPDLDRGKTSPAKSNLTFTGQLLDSIKGGAINARQFFIEILEQRNDGVKNSDIVDGQEDQGRKFFYFSSAEIKGIYNRINAFLRKELKL